MVSEIPIPTLPDDPVEGVLDGELISWTGDPEALLRLTLQRRGLVAASVSDSSRFVRAMFYCVVIVGLEQSL